MTSATWFLAGLLMGAFLAGLIGWEAWRRERMNLRFVQAWNQKILEGSVSIAEEALDVLQRRAGLVR